MRILLPGLVTFWSLAAILQAAPIGLPNYSFESPFTVYVETNITHWQKSPRPFWYDESANGSWDQLSGVFMNPPIDTPNSDHIGNCEGSQAAYLFALPGVALLQDNTTSASALDVKFEPGKSYQLTVGVLGNGGGMSNGATLQIAFYYRDAASQPVTVAATTITNSSTLFPDHTNLVDFHAKVPVVKASDAWAGRNIGVEIVSTVDFQLIGGYWDLDNVRLTSLQAPALSGTVATNGQFQFTLRSEPGLRFELLATTNVALPSSNWTNLTTLTNTTGQTTFTDSTTGLPRRFYQARQIP